MARVPHPTKAHAAMRYREPTSVRVGRYVFLGGAMLGVVAVLYSIAWFATSMMVRSNLQDWFKARASEGYIASYDDSKARISGFPFAVKVRLPNVRFAPPKDAQGDHPWIWSAQRADLRVVPLPWSFRTLHVDLSRSQSLTQSAQTYTGRAKSFDLSFDWMSKGMPDDLNIKIVDLVLDGLRNNVNLTKFDLAASRLSDGDYAFDINGERLTLPNGMVGMGRYVEDIILRGRITQNFAATGFGAEEIAKWRDAGGTLELERIQLGYSPLMMQGNGTLALDADLQPVGAFSARIQGFFETVNRLDRAGVIRGPDASMAKVVLGMLSKQPSNGGPATISLPLTIQERALFAGPVRLITIPQLKW